MNLVRLLVACIALCSNGADLYGQSNIIEDKEIETLVRQQQRNALSAFSREDTISASAFWPNVKPELFFANIRKNITYPGKINQGAMTNFCGYAAMTHLLVTYHPETYLRYIIDLYRNGRAVLPDKTLTPSEAVRSAAGTLKNKGELDILDADQLWFLTLADQFKGYMNIVDKKYHPGDENKIWAGTNFAKFNNMLKAFTDDTLTMVGSDFLRPSKRSFYEYIAGELQRGVVLLYVNSKFLYPHNFKLFRLRAPTHFIVLYNMSPVDDQIEIKYWDYGLKTQQLITRKRLFKLIFGITTISDSSQ